jgi:hypothetical protein
VNDFGQRAQVVAQRSAGEAPHRLARDAERIGQRQADPHGPKIDGEDAAGAVVQ